MCARYKYYNIGVTYNAVATSCFRLSGARQPPTMLPPTTVASPDDSSSDSKLDFNSDFDNTSIASNMNQVDPSSSPTKDEEDTPDSSTAPRSPQDSALKANRRQPLGLIEALSSMRTDALSHITRFEQTDDTHFPPPT